MRDTLKAFFPIAEKRTLNGSMQNLTSRIALVAVGVISCSFALKPVDNCKLVDKHGRGLRLPTRPRLPPNVQLLS